MSARLSVFKEIYAVFVLAHGYVLGGCTYGFSGIIIPQMENLTTIEQSWIGAMSNLFSPIFVILVTYLMGKVGRKQNLQLGFIFFVVGWCALIFAQNVFAICVCFTVLGYATANHLPICFTYISETCKKERRGMYMSIDLLCMTFGQTLDYTMGYFLSWRVSAAIVFCLALSGLLQSFIIPETKYWHLLSGDEKSAERTMLWFEPHLTKSEIDREIKSILDSMPNSDDRKSKIFEFLKCFGQVKYLKPLALAVILPIVRSCCGTAIVVSYAVEFFQDFQSPYDSKKLSVLFAVLATFGSFLNSVAFRYCKRKLIFYTYSTIMIVTLSLTIGYHWYFKRNSVDPLPWIPIGCILIYISMACTGLMTCVSIICAESQSAYFRAEAMSLFGFILNLATAAVVYAFPLLEYQIALDYILIFFLCNVLVGLLTVVFMVSETRDLKFYETGNAATAVSKPIPNS